MEKFLKEKEQIENTVAFASQEGSTRKDPT